MQDPQTRQVLHVAQFKFKDKDTGTTFQIDWRLLRSSAAADHYEFKILTGSNVLPIVKRISVSADPVELLKAGDTVVTIRQKVFDQPPPAKLAPRADEAI